MWSYKQGCTCDRCRDYRRNDYRSDCSCAECTETRARRRASDQTCDCPTLKAVTTVARAAIAVAALASGDIIGAAASALDC